MRSLLPLVLLAACGAAETTGSDGRLQESLDVAAPAEAGTTTGCDYEQRAVEPDFVQSELSAPDLLAVLATDHVETLQWDATGQLTELSLWVETYGNLRQIRSFGEDCPEYLLVDAAVVLQTADGRLDEAFDATFRYEANGIARLERWVAVDQLAGDFDPRELEASVYTAADLEIVASFSTVASVGELALYAQREDGDTDAWDLGRWPASQ